MRKRINLYQILIFTLFWGILISIGCHVNSGRINNDSDINEAIKVTNKFYMYFHNSEYTQTYQFLGKKMLETTDTASFKQFLKDMIAKFGKIKDYQVISKESKVISGTDPISQYHIVYENTYVNGKVIEDFILEKENNSIKIIGYHITTDKF